MIKAIYNCRVFTGNEVVENGAILIEAGRVVDVLTVTQLPSDIPATDLEGLNIAPSLIDLQIYGGNGMLFSQDLSMESLNTTYQYCLEGGAGHFMITMATNSIECFLQGVQVVQDYWNAGRKGLLGLHLEGPFINPVKKGAHIAEYVIPPSRELLEMLMKRSQGVIRMMTIAPEVCGQWVYDILNEYQVLISAGHSNASFLEASSAFQNGVPAATHLFNAMSPLQGREPGMVGAIYDHQSVMSSVVCDGVHVDFASIRLSKKLLKERLFFITDAVTETRQGAYIHEFRGDRYCLPDGTLSGSALTMMQCVKNGVLSVGIDLAEALRMASLYPARLARIDKNLGSIEKGKEASFVIFDDSFSVRQMIVE